jgi:hypothetical protein
LASLLNLGLARGVGEHRRRALVKRFTVMRVN